MNQEDIVGNERLSTEITIFKKIMKIQFVISILFIALSVVIIGAYTSSWIAPVAVGGGLATVIIFGAPLMYIRGIQRLTSMILLCDL